MYMGSKYFILFFADNSCRSYVLVHTSLSSWAAGPTPSPNMVTDGILCRAWIHTHHNYFLFALFVIGFCRGPLKVLARVLTYLAVFRDRQPLAPSTRSGRIPSADPEFKVRTNDSFPASKDKGV